MTNAPLLLPPSVTVALNGGADHASDVTVSAVANALARRKGFNELTLRMPADDGHMLLNRQPCTVRLVEGTWHARVRSGDAATSTKAEGKHVALSRLIAVLAEKTVAADAAKPLRTFVLRLEPGYGKIRTAATEQHRRVPNVVEMLARHGWVPTPAMPAWKNAQGKWSRPEPVRKPNGMIATIEEPGAAHIADRLVARRVVEPIVTAQEGEAA
ncbi:hypothetical protein [Aureimonas sp. AU40]|uniref:hypothetical protein n=1 Tax=Aureimonas sp. AU40 TaxID=1637747 RepID=UPI000781ABE5|nr:hypothetical protein [Aureimonas sp. AU40]